MRDVVEQEGQMGLGGEKVYRAKEAAGYLGLSYSTLAKMRMRDEGPAFVQASPRMVLYLERDLNAWLASRRRAFVEEVGI